MSAVAPVDRRRQVARIGVGARRVGQGCHRHRSESCAGNRTEIQCRNGEGRVAHRHALVVGIYIALAAMRNGRNRLAAVFCEDVRHTGAVSHDILNGGPVAPSDVPTGYVRGRRGREIERVDRALRAGRRTRDGDTQARTGLEAGGAGVRIDAAGQPGSDRSRSDQLIAGAGGVLSGFRTAGVAPIIIIGIEARRRIIKPGCGVAGNRVARESADGSGGRFQVYAGRVEGNKVLRGRGNSAAEANVNACAVAADGVLIKGCRAAGNGNAGADPVPLKVKSLTATLPPEIVRSSSSVVGYVALVLPCRVRPLPIVRLPVKVPAST